MHRRCISLEGPSSPAGCSAQPVDLPVLKSSIRQPRRTFFTRSPILDLGSPKSVKNVQTLSIPAAIQTPEKTLDPDKKDLGSSGIVSNGRVKETPSPTPSPIPSPTPPTHVEWYNKNKELWFEAHSAEELTKAMQTEEDKYVVVDFYAGWCSSCKAAYPALCKVAGNEEFKKNFKFVKADVQIKDVAMYIRTQGVRGIPTIIVFAPGGEKVAHFGASFRKINMVKANLTVISANRGADFSTDPEGYVFPRPDSV